MLDMDIEDLVMFCVDSMTTVEIFVSLTLERDDASTFSWLESLSIMKDGTEQVSASNHNTNAFETTDTFTLFLKQTNAWPANYSIRADSTLRSMAPDPLIKPLSFQWGAKVYKDFYALESTPPAVC